MQACTKYLSLYTIYIYTHEHEHEREHAREHAREHEPPNAHDHTDTP